MQVAASTGRRFFFFFFFFCFGASPVSDDRS